MVGHKLREFASTPCLLLHARPCAFWSVCRVRYLFGMM